MSNDIAIATAPPTVAATTAAPVDPAATNNDFVVALANVLSAEAAAASVATGQILPPAASAEDELGNLEELVEAAVGIDPQAMMLSLEQAQRAEVPVAVSSEGGTRAIGSQSDRAILAAMTAAMTAAGAALSIDDQSGSKNPVLLDALRNTDSSRDSKFEIRQGVENSQATLLASNSAAHDRIAELGEKPVIRAHVGSATWTEQLAGKLTLMVGRGIQSASIQLSPENLGPLEIRISVQNEQTSVWFGAAHAETRAALEQALPRLRELLAGQGLNLSDAGVFQETPRQPQKAYVPAALSNEGEREFNVAIGVRGMVDAYA